MKYSYFWLPVVLVSLAMLGFGFHLKKSPAPAKPNVVIIFMDDMGYGDPECYGGTQYKTPHMNRLAAEGMRFTHFYAAQATCSASRAALLTGCYPNRIGLHGAFMPNSLLALHHQEETIAEVLKKRGYATGMVGKWHLGAKEPFLPLSHGFDEYLGLPYSNDMWPVDYDGKPAGATSGKGKYPPLFLLSGNKPLREIKTLQDQASLTGTYTQKATQFIRDNAKKPFFLYLAHSMPHVPIAASEKFKGKSKAGVFGDMMMELDWSVGEIMRTLKELKLDENTLVILTSDNGPWLNYGNHAGNAGGLREGKGTTWEGGMRVPAIFRWKNTINPGTLSGELATTMDILPTLAHFAGAPLPSRKIDGVNIAPLLLEEPNAQPRQHLAYYYDQNNLKGVRQGVWKLVFPHSHRTYKAFQPGQNGWPGEVTDAEVPLALYNLSTDPGETQDLQKSFPEVVKELTALADQFRQELGDDLTHHPGTARRPAGAIQ
ncbi:MAG: sulfatase [Rufibacter sp.]